MLVSNKGGHMVTLTNAVVQEKAYRTVTRHVTHTCDGLPLNMMPVILTQRGVIDVIEKCRANTPRLAKKKRASSTDHAKSGPPSPTTAAAAAGTNVPMIDTEQKAASDEEKEPTSISRVHASTPSGDGAGSPSIISRTDSAPPPLSRTVSTSTTVPATNAFEEPTSQFVTSSSLYPPPTVQSLSADPTQVAGVHTASLEWSWLVGRFLGQALMEQRLLDLPFSRTLLKQLARPNVCTARSYPAAATCRRGGLDITVPQIDNQRAPVALLSQATSIPPPPPSLILPLMMDLIELAPHLAKPMLKLLAISYHQFSPHLFPLPSSLLTVDGASLESLDFDFTLPGSPEIELVSGGASISVTSANVHLWIWLVARQMVSEGVIIQMHCMQQGLKQAMDIRTLQPFYPHGQTGCSCTTPQRA
jgi:hypothetical protein